MLEVKVTVHGHSGSLEVAHVAITQRVEHEGSLRSYEVLAWRDDMRSSDRVYTATRVNFHDWELPVWELLKRALENLR